MSPAKEFGRFTAELRDPNSAFTWVCCHERDGECGSFVMPDHPVAFPHDAIFQPGFATAHHTKCLNFVIAHIRLLAHETESLEVSRPGDDPIKSTVF
jgi:hypothetical protein